MRGLIVGRFQPFHLGHLSAVKEILQQCDQVVIAIGSAQYSHTKENPFTASERYEMIHRTCEYEGISDRALIVPVTDINQNALWVAHVRATVPEFRVIYTNNPLTMRLFGEAGYEVRQTRMYSRERYCGSLIREQMINGGHWEQNVPEVVVERIREIRGVERIRAIFNLSKDISQ
jgi:nicotinamide-nucleotide adenylyltransferase